MANLKDFFRDLLNWEEQQPNQTIHQWYQELRDTVAPVFEGATSEKGQQSAELIIFF